MSPDITRTRLESAEAARSAAIGELSGGDILTAMAIAGNRSHPVHADVFAAEMTDEIARGVPGAREWWARRQGVPPKRDDVGDFVVIGEGVGQRGPRYAEILRFADGGAFVRVAEDGSQRFVGRWRSR